MRAHSSTKADDIDLLSLLGALRRNLPRLVMFTAMVGVGTFGVLSMMAPKFVSEAQLAIVAKTTNPFPDAKKEGGSAPDTITPRLDKEAVNTHVRALIAPDLVLSVANDMKLNERPEFNNALGDVDMLSRIMRTLRLAGPRPGQSEIDRVLESVYARLEVSAPRESRFINVRMVSADPRLAAEFANNLAESYRARLVTVPVQETEDVVKVLGPKVEQLRREVMESEAAVERYRAQTDQFRGGATNTPVNDQRMAALNDELTKAEALRAELDARWRTARELMQTDSADILPDVQRSPLIQQLIQQRIRLERQIAEAQAALLPGHPRMVQLNADLNGMKRQIKAEVGKVVQSLEKESKAAGIRVDTVLRQIAELKTKVVNTSGNEAQLRALESASRSKRSELEQLQKQLEFNNTLKQTKSVPIEAQIVSQARPASVPVWPKKGPWSMLAALAAFILGAVTIVTRELVAGPSGSKGGQGGLGGPRAARPSGRDIDPVLPAAVATAGVSRTSELSAAKARKSANGAADGGIGHITATLMNAADGKTGFRSMITGQTPAIDPTTEALDVASALSAAGKTVVLVDWNLDGMGMADQIGIEKSPGITDIITGAVSFEDVIARLPETEVHFVACGERLASEDQQLDADRLNLALDALDEVYDHILVVGGHAEARELFQAIQGRFDAGVSISDARNGADKPADGAITFLGFEVADMLILRHARIGNTGPTGRKRISGLRSAVAGEARP